MRRKGMILVWGMVLLVSLTVVSQAEELKVRVIVDQANIRLKPDLTSQVVAQVPLGTILDSQGKKGEWFLVSLPPDEKGFVVSGYIHQSIVEQIAGEIEEAPEVERRPPVVPRVQEEMPRTVPPPAQRVYAPSGVEIGAKSGVGLRAGYAMPSEEKYGSGLMYGANLILGVSKNFALEISGLRYQSDVEGDPEGLSTGKLSVMPLQLSIQIRFPVSGGQFAPYIHGGGGYYLNSFTLDEGITEDWDALGFDIEETIENAIGFHVGAGMDYFFTENIAFNADFRYCIAKAKGAWTITDQVGGTTTTEDLEDLSLNAMMIGGGLKFCF